MQPLLIDGDIGYGQVLRTTIALSALSLMPVKIVNIRKKRIKPGLRPQHLMGVKVAGEFCAAEIKGLNIGSTELEFIPKKFNLEDKKIDIGTAGQISLLLQTLTPLLIFSEKTVCLEIVGGTFGRGAPTIEYFSNVALPLISKLGAPVPEIEIVRQGGYPKGGGKVKIKYLPTRELKSIRLKERGEIKAVKGISVVGSLPRDVLDRQTNAAIKTLKDFGFEAEILPQFTRTLSSGTSITLWAECENSLIGADKIGERGVRAETVGESCAKELIKSLEAGTGLDKYMSDQMIPFLALAEGKSEVTVEEVTEHCLTNIKVTESILPVKFEVEGNRIAVEGVGLKNSC